MAAAVVAASGLQMTLPARLSLGPHWLLPALEVLLLGALRAGGLTLAGLLSLANAGSAALLVSQLAHGSKGEPADALLLAGGALWAVNVLIFALWYWELDRGGPADRCHAMRAYPDLLFPQIQQPSLAPPEWQPRFPDYLYLSFTNAISFAPSDVIPLTRWAKTMMMLQSAVSVAAIALAEGDPGAPLANGHRRGRRQRPADGSTRMAVARPHWLLPDLELGSWARS
jgi:hypothetical protein